MNRNIDIREADEMARAMNAYNERVGRAVDAHAVLRLEVADAVVEAAEAAAAGR